ncbi:MAG: DUF3795 domain-containing protein [Treponema sp.]|nr:DUF3795 domain-containing protein [Treponema sp.]
MFESRCGVRCSVCGRKADGICTGCLVMEKTFWGGECKVRSCCTGRKLDHCGQCPDFLCSMLSNMGKAEGFDPSVKLAQCRTWREEELQGK